VSQTPPEPADGQGGQPPVTSAVRLVFSYEGDEVRLLQQLPVDVAVTGFDLDQPQPQDGHVVEVRSGAGEPLARVAVRSGPQRSAEVFPEQPGEPIVRVEGPPTGAFTVVVPASEAAARVTLLRMSPAAPAGDDGTAAAPGAGTPSVPRPPRTSPS
jgi:hypothetical protein